MIAARLARFFQRASRLRYVVPEDRCIYAIGDVHGCIDPLNRLLEKIDKDLRQRPVQSHLIFLGDLVDRGSQSAAVVANNPTAERKAIYLLRARCLHIILCAIFRNNRATGP